MNKYAAILGAAWLGVSMRIVTGFDLFTWQYHIVTLPTLFFFWVYIKQFENK